MKRVTCRLALAALAMSAAACSSGSDSTTGPTEPSCGTGNVVRGPITANCTLRTGQTYVLSGYVKVQNGATMTIEPGTRIVGDTATPGSSLWILRGARLVAEGTQSAPIVFTSARAAGNRRPGDWGGIVIVGNGRINRTANPVLTEGGAAGIAENYAGGTNDADNSGSLRYVRIEFAGYDISNGNGQELNGLSMYAVGSGTRLEYVETLAGLDDSFEWWGGAVDGRYLISLESGDDHFDWTEGYRGRNQFLIAYQSTRLAVTPGTGTLSTDPRGIEADGCDPNPTSAPDCTYTGGSATPTGMNTPYSTPVFANLSVVGPRGTVTGFPADGNGVVLRRGTGGTLDRIIIGGWPGIGLNGRDFWTDSLRLRDSLSVTNVVFAQNGNNYDPEGATGANSRFWPSKFTTSNHRTAANVTDVIQTLPTGTSVGNWTSIGVAATVGTAVTPPRLAARVTGYPYSGGWQTTSYVGAGDASNQWWTGWTSYATQ